jgi:hypothetical protein
MSKSPLQSAIEATEESIKGIGEGLSHGVTLVTGMGVSASQQATTATEETIQTGAKEIPRALGKIQETTAQWGRDVDESMEDTKKKGLAAKIGEKLQGSKEEFEQQSSKSDTKEMRMGKSDISLL